jgi:uncharacterized protein YcaQ
MPDATLAGLRRFAFAATLFAPVKLHLAIEELGFVQADPIRAPARAQDLILRHRVAGYRAGDLERRFAALGLEEDFLYAYGFVPEATWRLLHPRHDVTQADGRHRPDALAERVLAFVRERGRAHPRDLAETFGAERMVNYWGGFSKATTRALESLHRFGLLRVASRRDGIRVYEAATPPSEALEPRERSRRLLLVVLRLLSPISRASLTSTLRLLSRGAPGLAGMDQAVRDLLRAGVLAEATIDGEPYLWTAGLETGEGASGRVRFLAPFDPVVWDRRRFQHLWGWDYRFEAYTPAAKRRFGYYALPLAFGDRVVGWVNASVAGGRLDLAAGFAAREPKGAAFRRAFDAEAARFARFLGLSAPSAP